MPRTKSTQRSPRRESAEPEPAAAAPVCPLCAREIPPAQHDRHHLVPKSKGGRATEAMHRICHRQIHALFSETELARAYSTVEDLLGHPEVQTFVKWVRGKPNGYYDAPRRTRRLRRT